MNKTDERLDLMVADILQGDITETLREDLNEQKFSRIAQAVVDLARTTADNIEDSNKATKTLLVQHIAKVDEMLASHKEDVTEATQHAVQYMGEVMSNQELLNETVKAVIVLLLVPPTDANAEQHSQCRNVLLEFIKRVK